MSNSEIRPGPAGNVLPGSYVDLPAIFGGSVIAAAMVGVFASFGGALGLSTLSAEPGEGSGTLWMVVTALWTLITIIVSFAAGGYVAGRLRRRLDTATGEEVAARDGLNGLIVWGLGTLIAGWMVLGAVGGAISAAGSVAGTAVSAVGTAAGGLASGAGTAVGGVVSAAGSALGGAAQGIGSAVAAGTDDADTEGAMTYFTDSLLRPAIDGARSSAEAPVGTPTRPSMNDAELSRQVGVVLGNVLRTGEISDQDRAFLVAATAQRTGLSTSEVEARVDEAVTRVQEVRAEAERRLTEAREEAERLAAEAQAEAERLAAEAKQAAIDAAETARKGAILTAFLLAAAALVAAGASLAGGVVGGRHRDEGRVFGGFNWR